MRTAPLFEAEIRHEAEAEPVGPTDDHLFPYLGSGGGAVSGPRIERTLRWSFFDEQAELVCRARRVGLIETTDGATIKIEELGYVLREGEGSSRWRFVGGLRLESADQRHAWLNSLPALLEGDFDTATGRGALRAFALHGEE